MKSVLLLLCVVVCSLLSCCQALYDHTDEVYDLNPNNFEKLVIDSHFVWIVEFYAPWCGHCRALVPEYKKASLALKGIVRLGAVDADQHKALGAKYGVQGFPTIKVFGTNKNSPSDYRGARTADAIVNEAMSVAKTVAMDRLSGKKTGGGGGGGSSGGGRSSGGGSSDNKDVVQLTDSNFEETVINSDDMWLVEFFAPWCGHCKNLAPHWASAATELKGKVKLGALDATVHTVMASRYGIQGFPTIKYFPAGRKDWDSAQDYDGGRTGSDIVQWATNKWSENLPPPEIYQMVSQEVLEQCSERQLCFVAFLPHILDSMTEGRNNYIQILKTVAEKYKQRSFGWIWAEGGQNFEFEQSLDVGGFGYPALVTINSRRKIFSLLRGPFSQAGIVEFIRELVAQRGLTIPFRKNTLPTIQAVEPWDGKDGELPVEDYDLSDFDMDDDITGRDEL